MAETYGHILIDLSLDHERSIAAAAAADSIMELAASEPDVALDALTIAHSILARPDADNEQLLQTGLQDQALHMASAVLELLELTEHGKYLDYDDITADRQLADPRHNQLADLVRRSNERQSGDISHNKRRVALSGLHIFIKQQQDKRLAEPASEVA
jgi:hypothetical protein